MNHLLIGTADKTARLLALAGPRFLLVDDGPIAEAFLQAGRGRLFDIQRHSFNPLRSIDYKRARDIAAALYTASPEGQDTLTVRNGKRALTKILLAQAQRFDKLPSANNEPGADEALATVDDMLLSPVLRRILCNPTNFSFKGGIVARIDRAQIGDFDAFLLASLLIGQFQGQVIVPDFGFYGRDFYSDLVRQNRLIASLNFLSEVSPKLQQMLLSIKEKSGAGCAWEDAKVLASHAGHARDTTGYNDFVHSLMAPESI